MHSGGRDIRLPVPPPFSANFFRPDVEFDDGRAHGSDDDEDDDGDEEEDDDVDEEDEDDVDDDDADVDDDPDADERDGSGARQVPDSDGLCNGRPWAKVEESRGHFSLRDIDTEKKKKETRSRLEVTAKARGWDRISDGGHAVRYLNAMAAVQGHGDRDQDRAHKEHRTLPTQAPCSGADIAVGRLALPCSASIVFFFVSLHRSSAHQTDLTHRILLHSIRW